MIDKNTIPYETFISLPVDGDKRFKNEIIWLFWLALKDDVCMKSNHDFFEDDHDWYAVVVWVAAMENKTHANYFVPWVTFEKSQIIGENIIAENAKFYRRNDESVYEIKKRIELFIEWWWKHYVVYENEWWTVIATMNVKIQETIGVVFSFLVSEEWRKKWVWKMLVANVHNDLLSHWVKKLWAKTKNKYVYYLLTRWYWWKILWKELYKKK